MQVLIKETIMIIYNKLLWYVVINHMRLVTEGQARALAFLKLYII